MRCWYFLFVLKTKKNKLKFNYIYHSVHKIINIIKMLVTAASGKLNNSFGIIAVNTCFASSTVLKNKQMFCWIAFVCFAVFFFVFCSVYSVFLHYFIVLNVEKERARIWDLEAMGNKLHDIKKILIFSRR